MTKPRSIAATRSAAADPAQQQAGQVTLLDVDVHGLVAVSPPRITNERAARLAQIWCDFCDTHALNDGDPIPAEFHDLLVEIGSDPKAAGLACAGLARLFPSARARIVAEVADAQ